LHIRRIIACKDAILGEFDNTSMLTLQADQVPEPRHGGPRGHDELDGRWTWNAIDQPAAGGRGSSEDATGIAGRRYRSARVSGRQSDDDDGQGERWRRRWWASLLLTGMM
jgi:hypothetical protein